MMPKDAMTIGMQDRQIAYEVPSPSPFTFLAVDRLEVREMNSRDRHVVLQTSTYLPPPPGPPGMYLRFGPGFPDPEAFFSVWGDLAAGEGLVASEDLAMAEGLAIGENFATGTDWLTGVAGWLVTGGFFPTIFARL
jgi:hypothetical protein